MFSVVLPRTSLSRVWRTGFLYFNISCCLPGQRTDAFPAFPIECSQSALPATVTQHCCHSCSSKGCKSGKVCGRGTAMENLNVLFPDLTEEQQDIFQRVFTADASYLENHERMNQSFWESLVKCLATTDPPILNTEEKTNLLNSCSVLPGGCAACLEAIEKKGVRAMALLYLLLKATNPSGYRQLPSSKGKDEKLKTLKRLERNLMLSRGEKKAENSSHESMDEDTEGTPADIVPYRDSEIARREDSIADAYEKENTRLHQWTVRWMGIRKDDEFFHFVILCFAIGALLICYYYYKDWTISLGIGLITFASLETTGIYFGLVYRIRSVLNSFVPLIDKFRPPGNTDLPPDRRCIPQTFLGTSFWSGLKTSFSKLQFPILNKKKKKKNSFLQLLGFENDFFLTLSMWQSVFTLLILCLVWGINCVLTRSE
ncbi:transmembrane protein 40 isoform X2 [Tyto alba]|uniref:transmembrane protein 40 isoform X2 n=1 Tax=Tyto alba TaxID=56313 RepID=UPI001C67BAEF|nr:transmembrane protein 40 isoform X2 [Tyto alba]